MLSIMPSTAPSNCLPVAGLHRLVGDAVADHADVQVRLVKRTPRKVRPAPPPARCPQRPAPVACRTRPSGRHSARAKIPIIFKRFITPSSLRVTFVELAGTPSRGPRRGERTFVRAGMSIEKIACLPPECIGPHGIGRLLALGSWLFGDIDAPSGGRTSTPRAINVSDTGPPSPTHWWAARAAQSFRTTPKGLCIKAQGWTAGPTLGSLYRSLTTPKGVASGACVMAEEFLGE